MAEAFVKDHDPFRCSVCLDPLRIPVTIPCGHSYCMSCISACWDQEDEKGEYSCPQCRESFTPRPVLRKSTMLDQLVEEKLKMAEVQAQAAPSAPGDVECDICTGRKRKADKSCLVCLVSFCQIHIQPHYGAPALKKHKLVNASTQLEQRICSQHDRLLEMFCQTDHKMICVLCAMDEHKGHDTVSPAVGSEERESQVADVKKTLQQRIQEREEEAREQKKTLMSHKRYAKAIKDQSNEIFSSLCEVVKRRRVEVKRLIRDQELTVVRPREKILQELEQEIAELRRKDDELERLSCEDHLQVFQTLQFLSTPDTKEPSSHVDEPNLKDLYPSITELKKSVENICTSIRSLVSKEESTIHIDVHDFSQLSEKEISPFVFVRNMAWNIMISPISRPDTAPPQKRLGFYLQCRPITGSE
ncbi:E3 ubiquitin/ISG15 ligase TRIM25-like isoform X2 [Clupea harengus]|nr:E3 ubiquitin/ISG15 ligase TRIM25-like isoform X2 [Clupea harengus]